MIATRIMEKCLTKKVCNPHEKNYERGCLKSLVILEFTFNL